MYKELFKKLWKAATAYIVGSFALIQFASVSFTYFDVEQSLGLTNTELMQLLFIILPLGLPFSLILIYFIKKNDVDISDNKENTFINNKKNGSYKQKIAVIPFTNLNNDTDGSFLVDGIVEDLITEFSMIKEIEILSRQTCFDYRDKNYEMDKFKNDFDLDYVVSGSIRILDNRLRVSVELSETLEGNVIWSNKYDRVKEDIFDIQDEIVRKITISLLGEIELSSLERSKRKPTESITSYEYLLKGKDLHHKFTKEANMKALEALDASINADTANSQAYAWKACALGQAYGRGYIEANDELYKSIMDNINKAVELNNNDFEAHRMLAEVHLSLHDFNKALIHGNKAFQLNPNDPRVTSVYGEILVRVKRISEGLNMLEKAYELDPVPQGQSTSDKRISALITGYYLSDNLNKCNELFKMIADIDFRSWLLVLDINQNHKNDNFNSIIKFANNFKDLDYQLEIDRFHLNDNNLKDSLILLAQRSLLSI
ncbi:MAG: hypothetical protein ACJ0E6_05855 [Gammaproteobacteria bacterium]